MIEKVIAENCGPLLAGNEARKFAFLHKDEGCCFTGYWEICHNENKTKKLFLRYDICTAQRFEKSIKTQAFYECLRFL